MVLPTLNRISGKVLYDCAQHGKLYNNRFCIGNKLSFSPRYADLCCLQIFCWCVLYYYIQSQQELWCISDETVTNSFKSNFATACNLIAGVWLRYWKWLSRSHILCWVIWPETYQNYMSPVGCVYNKININIVM